MIPAWTTAAIAVYVIILVASLATPLLGIVNPDSRTSKWVQILLWSGLALVVVELGALLVVALVQLLGFQSNSGVDSLRIGLLTFVFTAHAIWLLFGLGTLRVEGSAVRGPGTLLLGLACLFALACFVSTVLLAIRSIGGAGSLATVGALLIGILGLVPLVLFLVLLMRERARAPEASGDSYTPESL